MKTRTAQLLQTAKIIILALLLAFGISYLYAAWSPPTATPPSGNTPAPVNVGDASQIKAGGLWINKNLGVDWSAFILGNVGIGTTSTNIAGTVLDTVVVGWANPSVQYGVIVDKRDNGGARLGFANEGTYAAGMIFQSDERLDIETGGTNARITILKGGNVGIGTVNPGTNRLEVAGGPIKATGGLIIQTVASQAAEDAMTKVPGQIWLRTDL